MSNTPKRLQLCLFVSICQIIINTGFTGHKLRLLSDTRDNHLNQAVSRKIPKALNMAISLTFPPDRVALVTGGGRGIGEAVALTLSKGVSHVVIADMNEIAAQSVADRIVSSGGSASAVAVDVSNSVAVSDACSALVEQYGSVDVLVNNAGITRDNLVLRMSDSDWESVINVNLNSCFYFTKSLIRHMLKKRWGRVINMASVSGIGGNGGQTNYAAAKAAMIGLAKTLAKEFGGRGITSNAIAPGFIATPMTEKLTAEQKKAINDQIPAGRMGTAQDVADLVAFLSSDQASYINGHVVPVDGGMLFGMP